MEGTLACQVTHQTCEFPCQLSDAMSGPVIKGSLHLSRPS